MIHPHPHPTILQLTPTKLIFLWAIFKAAVIATITVAVLGTTFAQSIVIAVVSGSLGIIGMVGAAWVATTISRKEALHNREILQDIKKAAGISRRKGDTLDQDPQEAEA